MRVVHNGTRYVVSITSLDDTGEMYRLNISYGLPLAVGMSQ